MRAAIHVNTTLISNPEVGGHMSTVLPAVVKQGEMIVGKYVIERILGIFLPVLVVIVVGYAYARRVKPDMTQVNRLSMTILAPALVFSALASKEFDEALDAAEGLVDVEQRRVAMEKVEQILQDAAVMVQPLWQPKFFIASEKVQNLKAHPTQYHQFQRVWLAT